MKRNKGFTLIELMVVILIVAILAAVLAPMLTGRVQQAKWSEGKAAAGTIATALRAYWAEHEGNQASVGEDTVLSGLSGSALSAIGLTSADLDGKYFQAACYSFDGLGTSGTGDEAKPVYTITVDASKGKSGAPSGTMTLDQDGIWTETAASSSSSAS